METISDSPSSLFHDMLKPMAVIAIIIILVLFLSETLFGLFSSFRLISSRGNVKVVNVGVYWNANCTSPVHYLDWGNVEPNSAKNITVIIRNEGNEASSLFLNTTNWEPVNASNFIKLDWDYKGDLILPDRTIEATLTLSIAQITSGFKSFKFDIIIGVIE